MVVKSPILSVPRNPILSLNKYKKIIIGNTKIINIKYLIKFLIYSYLVFFLENGPLVNSRKIQ